jgi:hypothetical protein
MAIKHWAAVAAVLVLTGCDMARLVMGFTEPTVTATFNGDPIDLKFREGPGGLVIITGNVNGLGNADFILDTGAPVTVLLDGPGSKHLKLDSSKARKLGSADNPAAPVGTITPGFSIDFGAVKYSDLTTVVIPQNTMPCAERFAAINFQGVIGADMFKHFVVEIDHAAKRVRLYDQKHWKPNGGSVLPLSFNNGHIYADLAVSLNGSKVPVRMHVDTGKNESLSLLAGSKPEIVMPTEGEIRKACFVQGTVETRRGPPLEVALGGVSAKEVPTTYEQRDQIQLGHRHGAIGIGLLKRYVTTFDYAGKRMVLVERG